MLSNQNGSAISHNSKIIFSNKVKLWKICYITLNSKKKNKRKATIAMFHLNQKHHGDKAHFLENNIQRTI